MLEIAICDDEVQELKAIHSLVTEFSKLHDEMDISIRKFQSGYDLLDCIDAGSCFDIYLLDIVMPVMNGIDLGLQIRKKDEHGFIIYLTTSPDFALKSYQVSAFQYLVKPIDEKALYDALEAAIKRTDYETSHSIPVKTKSGISIIPLHRIAFAEYIGHSVTYHLSDGEAIISNVTREPFNNVVKLLLQDGRFIHCHVSFVVNMGFVSSITNRDFVMSNGQIVPISARHYKETKRQYFDYLLKGEGSILPG